MIPTENVSTILSDKNHESPADVLISFFLTQIANVSDTHKKSEIEKVYHTPRTTIFSGLIAGFPTEMLEGLFLPDLFNLRDLMLDLPQWISKDASIRSFMAPIDELEMKITMAILEGSITTAKTYENQRT